MEEINLAGEVFGDDEAVTADRSSPIPRLWKRSNPLPSQGGESGGNKEGQGNQGLTRDHDKRLDTDGDGQISDLSVKLRATISAYARQRAGRPQ